jgi:predicted transcriptional regulator of viral defense system
MKMRTRIIQHVTKAGTVRPRDLKALGADPSWLHRLAKDGELEHVGRGLYRLTHAEVSPRISLAELSKQMPLGVVCLLSALSFHEVGTQLPHETWMAMPPGKWTPAHPAWRLRVFRFSGHAYSDGIETHIVDNVPVQVYGVAKTVVDCFKFRNKVGLDVALEALREGWRARRFTMDELWRYAKVCRVARVMQPYLEALNG